MLYHPVSDSNWLMVSSCTVSSARCYLLMAQGMITESNQSQSVLAHEVSRLRGRDHGMTIILQSLMLLLQYAANNLSRAKY